MDSEVCQCLQYITTEIESSFSNVNFTVPEKYSNSICLRGEISLTDEKINLFDYIKNSVSVGNDIGNWEGQWGMTSAAFKSDSGVTSPFKYLVKLGQDFSMFQEEEKQNSIVNVVLTGSFQVKKNTLNPVQVYESDVVLKIEKSSASLEATTASAGQKRKREHIANVTGTGENRYGHFKLFGEYNLLSNQLNCFREYLRVQPKGRNGVAAAKAKRKPKRSRSKITASPITTNGKRERKPSAHLSASKSEISAASAFKKPKKVNSLKGTHKVDIQAIKIMIKKLKSDDKEKFFSQPVDPIQLNLPDYLDVIKCPMDLGTVGKKLDSNDYSDLDQCIKDIRLTFQNAMLYNPKKHPVHSIAKMHLNHFERDLKNFIKKKEKREKEMERKRFSKLKQKEKKRGRRNNEKMFEMSKVLEDQKRKFQKSKKKILEMFSSSEDEDSSDDDEEEEKRVTGKPDKKKRKKGKKGEMEYMKNMVSMMSNQIEMMQQWHNTSIQEIKRLNTQLNGTTAANNATIQQLGNPTGGYVTATPAYQQPMQIPQYGVAAPTITQDLKQPKKVRPLTISQMKQLSEDIHKLGAEDIAGLLEIVSGHGEVVNGEEIELDFEKMNPEIARTCYKYVSKQLSRAKSEAHISELQFDES